MEKCELCSTSVFFYGAFSKNTFNKDYMEDMNPWYPTAFSLYSVPQVPYQLSCLESSDANLTIFTGLWLTSSFMQFHSMLLFAGDRTCTGHP